jgi:ornithine cyclodeaminase/alanine dehydrogenase-like protein (mu-crystallin family)
MTRAISGREATALVGLARAFTAVEDGFAVAGRDGAFEGYRAHVQVEGGTFHVVGGGARFPTGAIVTTKVNGRFDSIDGAAGVVRGVLLVSDAVDGTPLALIESGPVTVLRTAAVAAVAVSHLTAPDADSLLLVGSGRVAAAIARAVAQAHPVADVLVWSRDRSRAVRLADTLRGDGIRAEASADLTKAALASRIIVTATASREPLIGQRDIAPGTTVLAFGADAPGKQELTAELVAHSTVITDSTRQCAASGELGYAIRAGLMVEDDVRGELASVVAGEIAGRRSSSEVVVFDSTGTAIADAAIARAILDEVARVATDET